MFICKNVFNRVHHAKLVTAGMLYHRNYTDGRYKNYGSGSMTQVVTHMSLRPEYITINN